MPGGDQDERSACDTMQKRLPIIRVFREYSLRANLVGDVVAGLSVGAMIVPQSIAHATIADLEPQQGLYTCLLPLLLYPVFATSRALAVGTGAVTALMVSDAVSGYADPNHKAAAASLMCFLAGSMHLMMGALNMGWIIDFMSMPVNSGFVSGCAVHIMAGQFKNLFGVQVDRHTEPYKLSLSQWELWSNLDRASWETILLSLSCFFILIILNHLKLQAESKPIQSKLDKVLIVGANFSALIVVLWGIIVVTADGNAGDNKFVVVGDLSTGLPAAEFPTQWGDIADLLPDSIAVAIVAFMSSIAVAKRFAVRDGYKISASQELLALGFAGLAGSLFGAMPIMGSLSRTAVNSQNAKSVLSSIIAGLVVFLALLVAMPLLHNLPKCALAAIIVTAAVKLVDLQLPAKVYKLHGNWKHSDLIAWAVAVIVTVALGVKVGLLTSVLFSLLSIVHSTHQSGCVTLGNLHGTTSYKNIQNYPDASQQPGVIVLRIEGPIYFANSGTVRDGIMSSYLQETRRQSVQPTAIVLDCGAVVTIDFTAERSLAEVVGELENKGVLVVLCQVRSKVQSMLSRKGQLGSRCSAITVHEAVNSVTRLLHEGQFNAAPSSPECPPSPGQSVQALRHRFSMEAGAVKEDMGGNEGSADEVPVQIDGSCVPEVELPGQAQGAPSENIRIHRNTPHKSDEISVDNPKRFSAFLLD